MRFHVVTLFPEIITAYTDASVLGRGKKNKVLDVKTYNIRDYARGKLRKIWPDGNVTTYVDDRPFGGGPGMVLRAEPILAAVESALKKETRNKKQETNKSQKNKKAKIVFFSPSGKQFTNALAKEWARKYSDIILISGRYEGVDARVKKILKAEDISIGPYVLTGGELPALTVIDSVSRQIPGVLGKHESLEESRVSSSEMYTRPESLLYNGKKYSIPKVLLTGDHKKIDAWKKKSL